MSLKEFLKPNWITISAFIVLMILFAVIPIVPCQKFPVIPNPIYTWSLCLLNPMPIYHMVGVGYRYFGLEFDFFNIMIAVSLIVSYLLASLVNSFFKRR